MLIIEGQSDMDQHARILDYQARHGRDYSARHSFTNDSRKLGSGARIYSPLILESHMAIFHSDFVYFSRGYGVHARGSAGWSLVARA